MKGWVYVISNQGHLNSAKVGRSFDDLELRAREFNGTHSPFPHPVNYATFTDKYGAVEQETHRILFRKRGGRAARGTGTECSACAAAF